MKDKKDKNTPKIKSPYHGTIPTLIVMCLPSICLTWMFYGIISMWQARFGEALNFASAKALGCGCGSLFHLCCWLMGAFKEPRRIVKERIKEFFSDLSISASLAFEWYWDDLKTNGAAYWAYLAVIIANICVTLSSFMDFVSLMGWKL